MDLCLYLVVVTVQLKINCSTNIVQLCMCSHLWDLTRQSVKTFCTKWHTVHRMALLLPYNTHCNLLPLIAENRPLDCVLEYRYIGFYKTILEPKNNIVKYIAHTRLYDYTFTMGRIMLHMSKYDLSIDYIRSLSNTNINRHCNTKWLTIVDNDYPIYAGIIREMFMM